MIFPVVDSVWNLRVREVAFALYNPHHKVLRDAGIALSQEPASHGTVVAVCGTFNKLIAWATAEGMPTDLGLWAQDDLDAYLDHRRDVDEVAPDTVAGDVHAIRYLHELAQVLTDGGLSDDPWEGKAAARVARVSRHRRPDAIATPTIPPETWWPLLRAAWTYIHSFAPDVLDLRDRLAEREAAVKETRPPTLRTSELTLLLDTWLGNPANRVPVHRRPWRGEECGTPIWSALSLLVTQGRNKSIFDLDRNPGRSRRQPVLQAVAEGRTVLVDGWEGSAALGVLRRPPQRHYRTRAELDGRLEQWLADPDNLIPIRGSEDPTRWAEGEPVWMIVRQLVFGDDSPESFSSASAAGRRRKAMVEAVAATGRTQVLEGAAHRIGRWMPCDSFAAVTRPDGTRGRWRSHISADELQHELRMIRAACYVFIAALSLMRDSEIQEIERGALTAHYGAPALTSRKIKHDPASPTMHWWIIEPVSEAVAVAERLSWHDTHVFATLKPPTAGPGRQPRRGRRGINAAQEIEYFITQVNATRHRTGLEEIPPAHVRPHMFRRTMSVITGQEPDSEVALGLQLKHAARRALANRVTHSYSQMDTSWAKEFDAELELAAARRLVDLLRNRREGHQVAVGPGAARLHQGLDTVIATMETDPALHAQIADEQVEVLLLRQQFPELHFGTINHCLWNAAYAECQKALPEDQQGQAPLLGACQPARCRNSIVIQQHHGQHWLAEERDLLRMLSGERLAPARRAALETRLAEVRLVMSTWTTDTGKEPT